MGKTKTKEPDTETSRRISPFHATRRGRVTAKSAATYAPWDNMLRVDEGGGVTICVCRPHRREYCTVCTVDYRDMNSDARKARSSRTTSRAGRWGARAPAKKRARDAGAPNTAAKSAKRCTGKTGDIARIVAPRRNLRMRRPSLGVKAPPRLLSLRGGGGNGVRRDSCRAPSRASGAPPSRSIHRSPR